MNAAMSRARTLRRRKGGRRDLEISRSEEM
jgi:hypothetical protein